MKYKIVPVVPTEVMNEAASETSGMQSVLSAIVFAHVHGHKLPSSDETPLAQAYAAMLDKAPEVSEEQVTLAAIAFCLANAQAGGCCLQRDWSTDNFCPDRDDVLAGTRAVIEAIQE